MATGHEGLRDGWLKSPYSTNGGNCVEVGILVAGAGRAGGAAGGAGAGDLFVLRNSRDPDGPRLYFTEGEWEAFARGVKEGAFDGLG